MSVRRLSTGSWHFVEDADGSALFRHASSHTHSLSPFRLALVCEFSLLQPMELGVSRKGRRYWLYLGEVYTSSRAEGRDEVVACRQRLERTPDDDLVDDVLRLMGTSAKRQASDERDWMKGVKKQFDSITRTIDSGHDRALRMLRERTRETKHSRHVPQDVKIRVVQRDGGMCSHLGCYATTDLHFDHRVPYSRGGRSDEVGNIQLLCSRHNLSKGKRDWGWG